MACCYWQALWPTSGLHGLLVEHVAYSWAPSQLATVWPNHGGLAYWQGIWPTGGGAWPTGGASWQGVWPAGIAHHLDY